MSFLAFNLSVFITIPVLVIAWVMMFMFLSGNREDRSFGWATFTVIVSIILVHFTWHITWFQIVKYLALSIGIGLIYTAFKWIREVTVYHSRVIDALSKVKYWPTSSIKIQSEDLDIGRKYLSTAEHRKDALSQLTPQFSEYKAPALGWTIFWPFFVIIDIAPIRVIETIINSFSKPAQYFANKIFEDKG